MKTNKVDIEKITRELIRQNEVKQPGADFTKNLMGKILKDPNIQISFIKKDDDKNSIWVILTLVFMFLSYVGFYIYKYGLNSITQTDNLPGISYFKAAADFATKLWSEITFSPIILLSFIGIILLVLFDRYIIKYLYSF